MKLPFRFPFLAVWLALSVPLGTPTHAGAELLVQPTPFTVWLDLNSLSLPNAPRPAFPICLESVEIHSPEPADPAPHTTFRLRLRRVGALNPEVLLRLFFEDSARPVVSAWSETGGERIAPRTVGEGTGLESSETLLIPTIGTDYIDIEVPGSGGTLRGVFLATLQKVEIRKALDFAAPEALAEPFQNRVPALAAPAGDGYLFGRVRAPLVEELVKLTPNEAATTVEFTLEKQPLMAVISFEILEADLAFPPTLLVNGRDFGPVTMALPDLADPGYRGQVTALESDMRFHYTGWLGAQKYLPGSALQAGENRITLQLPRSSGSIAIRRLGLQLKYPAASLDYRLSPLQP